MLATLLLAGIALATLLYLLAPKPQSRLPDGAQLPDGPPGQPLLGNLLQIPPQHSWLQFTHWSKQYGPLYRLNLAGQNHVIVSDERIAEDLLRERGNLYSSRPPLYMASELMSHGLRPVFMPYGDTWRSVRKLMHSLTNVSVATSYESLQEEESLRAVRDLMREPEKYETWSGTSERRVIDGDVNFEISQADAEGRGPQFERYSAGLILRLAYSKPVHTGEEIFVRRILNVVHTVERVASPGAYLVDAFPVLMRLPSLLAPFKREAKTLHAEEISLFRDLLREGVQASESAPDPGSANFCGKWAQNRDAYDLSHDHVAYVIGTLFEAGAGTTAAAMASFVLAMTLHPQEYAKLQQEVDAVVGGARLPRFDDLPRLPRVRAVAKEVLRWRPVTAGGFPHLLIKDDIYEMPDGRVVFLEKGTAVHGVQWSIHREAKLYPDPEMFRPERWVWKPHAYRGGSADPSRDTQMARALLAHLPRAAHEVPQPAEL
ncbi:hypothetical protein LTR53_001960 [Teratosphaeriaceae sp. CCFEE 6253]|nr:hypothetical protein LTR53_001960 [Teratosphaeriaceae sp. CCFEE 6253]